MLFRSDPPLNADGTDITSAHKIEKLVLYNQYGDLIRAYTSAEYNTNPHEYNTNYWIYAGILILAGVLCAGNGLFFFVRNRQGGKEVAAAERARLESMPSPFARELGTMANAQVYQGTEQYPQPYNNPYQGPQQ